MRVAHFGTFDVANFGDLLFPLILEHRLRSSVDRFDHYSPIGGPPIWTDCAKTIPTAAAESSDAAYDAVILGGGNVVSAAATGLARYESVAETAYPELWLTAARLAARCRCPLIWNCAGVAEGFGRLSGELVHWAADGADYLAVRDQTSRARMARLGAENALVAPDTGLDVARLWTEQERNDAYQALFSARGRATPRRAIAFHFKRRFMSESPNLIARRVDELCRAAEATPILLALGPCHGDDDAALEIERRLELSPLVIASPQRLLDVAAILSCSDLHLGSSLHGLMTAFAFGRPAVAIAPASAATRSKFDDFLTGLSRADGVADNWSQAIDRATTILGDKGEQEIDLNYRRDALEKHWLKIEAVLRLDAPRSTPVRLEQLDAMVRKTTRSLGPMTMLLGDQARHAQRWRRESTEQRDRRLTEGHATQERAEELQSRLASSGDEIRRLADRLRELERRLESSQQSVDRLTTWLLQVEQAAEAWRNSRRWRLGNRAGEAWRRLRGRPPVPLATDMLDDVFDRFHRWQDERSANAPSTLQRRIETLESHAPTTPGGDRPAIDVVICVHNALDWVKRCLRSVRSAMTKENDRLIVLDDASDADCANWLDGFRGGDDKRVVLIRNSERRGFSHTANLGLRTSRAEFVLLLNSDTELPREALDRLCRCALSDAALGIVGPLSNAASWQSIPERFDASRDWAINSLPEGWSLDRFASMIAEASRLDYPRVPLVNGFCMLIRRSVLESIGDFDEQSFPDGFGEENDLCLRAGAAGFEIAVADDAFVWHAKSKSYTHERRRRLSQQGRRKLLARHGSETLADCEFALRGDPVLARMRNDVKRRLREESRRFKADDGPRASRAAFVLPTRGGGGGVHSIVQECGELRRLGVDACVLIPAEHAASYRSNYGDEFRSGLFRVYESSSELLEVGARQDIVIGTISHSIWQVRDIVEHAPNTAAAYYVQDYEPWFYPEKSAERRRAEQSYRLLPDALLFAKTRWLCEQVRALHGVEPRLVRPSIDHERFFPNLARRDDGVVRVAAMIRPSTPRRGAGRTLRVLQQVQERSSGEVEVIAFGCTDAEIRAESASDFQLTNEGVLQRDEVARLLRRCDVFLDLSDYQAFGRTAIESMASGCAVVVTGSGGTTEFVRHEINGLVVDTASADDCLASTMRLIEDVDLRRSLCEQALLDASELSIRSAAISVWRVLSQAIERRRDATAVSLSTNISEPS